MPTGPGAVPAARWPASLVRERVGLLLEAAEAAPGGTVPIVQAGHPALRMRAVPYDGQLDAGTLDALVGVMRRTMHAAPGVGLAAPQIGLPLALAVLADPGAAGTESGTVRERPQLPFRVLVNPAYGPVPGEHPEHVAFYEGCLSVTGYQAVVPRLRQLRLTGVDELGAPLDEVVQGWPARIVQHETDHLNGTLYLDRAHLRSLSATDELGAHWASEPRPSEAARTLGFPLEG
ncbi:peptide deformylase [Cellulomonas sp. C5510]|uniref:peptide deformylase n=1 Tax=Cellulomonas sp. C5510 TaxID=2871170 RepID=UPI001C983F4C|nr:peptide deformylase [Cellulomonas sp. C5510]QZN85037.1 peptide deformylase [Cellulomonas sp. C5510]